MDSAIVFTYSRAFPGREATAFESFQDALTLFGKFAAEDRCLEPEVFTGPFAKGLMVIKGEREKLLGIIETEEFQHMYLKAGWSVPDIGYELFFFGDSVMDLMGAWNAVGKELEYV